MKNERKLRHFLKVLMFFILGLALIFGIAALFIYREYKQAAADLPPLNKIIHYKPFKLSRVYAGSGEVIGEFFLEKRTPLPLQKIPLWVRQIFVATEDHRFYEHPGVDKKAILRAFWANFTSGHIVQGGSTITQQVVKNLVVGKEKSYRRKIQEAVLAQELEKKLSKNQILEIYLNHIYFGSGAYGVEAASQIYFGKSVHQLNLAEAAMLAGLSKRPALDSPQKNPTRARLRQEYVLNRLVVRKKITSLEANLARLHQLQFQSLTNVNLKYAPYFVEEARKKLVKLLGSERVLSGGLKIYTDLSIPAQQTAEEAVKIGLKELNEKYEKPGAVDLADARDLHRCFRKSRKRSLKKIFRDRKEINLKNIKAIILDRNTGGIRVCAEGYQLTLNVADSQNLLNWRGPEKIRLRPGQIVIVDIKSDYSLPGRPNLEIKLAKPSPIQAALLAIDLKSGAIMALVGGKDFRRSEFNRAIQARRQIGSAVKGLVYAAAMENGFDELSVISDSPVAVPTISGLWTPKNYKREFLGPITLREAFAKSINTVSVKLGLGLSLSRLVKYFKKLGLRSPIPRHISISLGAVDASLMELTDVYATFPRQGVGFAPYLIKRVVDDKNQILWEMRAKETERLSPQAAYLMVDLMKAVTKFGTGRKAKVLTRPVAGKTGTSIEFRDAWFIGYSADIIVGVWVGRDDFSPIGWDATGGKTALPIWVEFMKRYHPAAPVRDFPMPAKIGFHFMPNGEKIPFIEKENEENFEEKK